MTVARRTLAAGALTAIALAAGCSSSTATVPTPAPVSSAPATGQTGSVSAPGAPTTASSGATTAAAPAPGATVDPAAFTKQIADASKNVKTASFSSQVESASGGMTSTGVADISDPNKVKTQSELTAGGQKAQIITIGTTQYTKQAGAAKWTKGTTPTGAANPADSIRNNVTYSSVTYVGPDTVDGVSVRKYNVTVDAGGQSIPSEIYLDSKSLLRKSVTTWTTGNATSKITATFSKYDEPVTITEPAASEVQ